MEALYLTIPVSGSKLMALIDKRIGELRAGREESLREEQEHKAELERQRKLAESDVDDIGCGTFRTLPARTERISDRNPRKIDRIIDSLETVRSILEADSRYYVTLSDLIRLDIITDTQSSFHSF